MVECEVQQLPEVVVLLSFAPLHRGHFVPAHEALVVVQWAGERRRVAPLDQQAGGLQAGQMDPEQVAAQRLQAQGRAHDHHQAADEAHLAQGGAFPPGHQQVRSKQGRCPQHAAEPRQQPPQARTAGGPGRTLRGQIEGSGERGHAVGRPSGRPVRQPFAAGVAASVAG